MRPRPGTLLDNIRPRFQQLASGIYNVREPMDYALWVDGAETALRECFVDVPFERLYSERYWRLTTGPHMCPYELLRAEQRDQNEWLDQILATTTAMVERFSTPPSTVVVLDTNVLMHAKPLHDIDWLQRLDASAVRLAVPMRVVDELDERKYGRRDDLRKRARRRVQTLAAYIDQQEIRDCVRIEVVSRRQLDPGGVPRPLVDPDVDILDTCEALQAYAAPNSVSVVTGDNGMKLRARERGLPVTLLDEKDMQTDDAPG